MRNRRTAPVPTVAHDASTALHRRPRLANGLAGLVERTTLGSLTGNSWEAQMLSGALRAIRAALWRCDLERHAEQAQQAKDE
jgi:hypothetical protein